MQGRNRRGLEQDSTYSELRLLVMLLLCSIGIKKQRLWLNWFEPISKNEHWSTRKIFIGHPSGKYTINCAEDPDIHYKYIGETSKTG